jgi:hypothetical protein
MTLALVEGEGRFASREKAPGNQNRSGLHEEEKNLDPYRDWNLDPSVIQTAASH